MNFNPTSWPAYWILDLIAQDNLKAFYTSAQWKCLSREIRCEQNKECQRCKRRGLVANANMTHHVKPLRERPDLALSRFDENGNVQLEAQCNSCHYKEHHGEANFINDEKW